MAERGDEIGAKAKVQQMESDAKTQAQVHGEQEALREKDAEFLFQDEADASRQGKLNHVLKSRVDVHRTSLMVNRVEAEIQQEMPWSQVVVACLWNAQGTLQAVGNTVLCIALQMLCTTVDWSLG